MYATSENWKMRWFRFIEIPIQISITSTKIRLLHQVWQKFIQGPTFLSWTHSPPKLLEHFSEWLRMMSFYLVFWYHLIWLLRSSWIVLKRNQLEVLLNFQLLASGVPLKAMTAVQAGFMGKARLLNLGVADVGTANEESYYFHWKFGMWHVVPVVPDFSTNSCIITNITAIIVTLLQPNASPFHPFPMPLAGSCWNSTGISCGHVPWHGYWLLATQGPQSMAILRFHPIRCVLGRDSYTLNRSQEAWFNLFHVQISYDQILYLPN